MKVLNNYLDVWVQILLHAIVKRFPHNLKKGAHSQRGQPDPTCLEKHLTKKKKKEDTNQNFKKAKKLLHIHI